MTMVYIPDKNLILPGGKKRKHQGQQTLRFGVGANKEQRTIHLVFNALVKELVLDIPKARTYAHNILDKCDALEMITDANGEEISTTPDQEG